MTQEVHVELNPGLPWKKKGIRLKEDSFRQQIGLQFNP